MRNTKSNKGFTLIELLIVIAIIGILAAVLIPNLLSARARAFDTAAQTCLKEIGVQEEINASVDPWQYANDLSGSGDPNSNGITSCDGVTVSVISPATADTAGDDFHYTALHDDGNTTFQIANGTGVTTYTAPSP